MFACVRASRGLYAMRVNDVASALVEHRRRR